MKAATVDEAIADIRKGRMVIVRDSMDRENEGDLVFAAQKVTASKVNFMIKEGGGLICVALTRESAANLELSPNSLRVRLYGLGRRAKGNHLRDLRFRPRRHDTSPGIPRCALVRPGSPRSRLSREGSARWCPGAPWAYRGGCGPSATCRSETRGGHLRDFGQERLRGPLAFS
jgi:hypothetical protein